MKPSKRKHEAVAAADGEGDGNEGAATASSSASSSSASSSSATPPRAKSQGDNTRTRTRTPTRSNSPSTMRNGVNPPPLPPTSSAQSPPPSSSYKGKQRQQSGGATDASTSSSIPPRPTSPNNLKRTQQQPSPTASRKAPRTTNASPSATAAKQPTSPSPSPTRSRSRSPSPRSSPASPSSSRTSPTSRRTQSSKSPPTPRPQRRVDQHEDDEAADDSLNDGFDAADLVDELSGGSTSVDSDTEERDVVISDGDSHFTLRVPQPLLLTSTIARGAYHQCGTARRVKVYELAGETWEDRGTGYCAGVYDEGQDEALLVARLEEHSIKLEGAMPDPRRPPNRLDPLLPLEGGDGTTAAESAVENGPFPYFLIVSQDLNTDAIMLKSRVVREDVYQKQQETLVVWTEPDGTDMALSFQEAEGCLEVWEFIIEVQKHFHLNSGGMQHDVLSDPPTPDPGSPSSADYGVSAMGMGGLMQMDAGSFALPNPSLGTIARIDAMLKAAATKNPNLRERVAEWLARSSYIRKLTAFFQDVEYLEELDALHCLCSIMQTIVMMNDSMIIETILQDDVFLDVVGMFEYDPEFPTLKASYRDYIENTAKYKQVVPIDDPKVVVKIHQAYRLQYLKDVILARILDDAMFSVLNSWIFFHQVDIVNYCTSNEAFLPQLFAICATDSTATQERKHEAVYLLQHLCAIGKQIQLPSRITLCKTLAEKGLLSVVEYALFEKVEKVQNAAAEMLMVLVEYDPNSVRNYVLAQVAEKQPTLVKKIAELLHTSADLGLKAQMAEVLRILFDNSAEAAPPNASLAAAAAAARTKGEPDKFLTWFYEADVEHVFSPIKRLQRVNTMDPATRLDLSPRHHSALLGHLCDLLCYTVAQHTFRSQYYVITSEIGAHVGSLLYAKEKHMRLAAIKFFRTCLAANNQFMNRHFAKQGIFESLLRLVQRESARDNLVLSACLELFEAISSQNIRTLVSHLGSEPCRALMVTLSEKRYTGKCFKTLVSQADSWPADKSSAGAGADAPSSSSQDESSRDLHVAEEQRRRARDLMARGVHRTSEDEDEDSYFHDDDEEEEDDDDAYANRAAVQPLRRQGSTATLVPYPDDEQQSDESSSVASSEDEEVPVRDSEKQEESGAGAGGFFRAGTKRPGEALKPTGATKKIALGLSSSSRKMAAGEEGEKSKGEEKPSSPST